jgi:hypothetical protein
MAAIQRWYLLGLEDSGFRSQEADPKGNAPQDHLWCRAPDVIQLETLLAQYLETIRRLRVENTQQRTSLLATEERVRFLERMNMDMQHDHAQRRVELESLRSAMIALQRQYDAVMQRQPLVPYEH